MAERLENIRKFQADVEQCMKCGFCGYFCPIYREEREEKGLARGKDQLIRSVLDGEQELSPGFYQAIDNCLLCKTCVQYCPAKTRTDHAVMAARADYVAEKGLPLAKRIVFRWVLPNRWLFGVALRLASWFQRVLPRGEGRFRHLPQFLSALGAGGRFRKSPRDSCETLFQSALLPRAHRSTESASSRAAPRNTYSRRSAR